MASLPALVSAIAEVDGRERVTIEHAARLIREAGFIPTGKRGGGAAEMDYTAAANLLIGINGADSAKDAVWALSIIRFLRGSCQSNESDPAVFQRVAAASCFGEALETFIEGTPELLAIGCDFIKRAYDEHKRPMMFSEMLSGSSGIGFVVDIQRTFASISCRTPQFDTPVQWQARFYLDWDDLNDDTRRCIGRLWDSDRKVSVQFGLPTLMKVWECIEGQPGGCRRIIDG